MMLHFNAFKQIANRHTPNDQVQVFNASIHILLSPQLELRGLHSPNQEKMPLKLSFLLSLFRSEFLCIFVLLLKLLSYIRLHNILLSIVFWWAIFSLCSWKKYLCKLSPRENFDIQSVTDFQILFTDLHLFAMLQFC